MSPVADRVAGFLFVFSFLFSIFCLVPCVVACMCCAYHDIQPQHFSLLTDFVSWLMQ